jgi:hypothetical protein
MSKQSLLKLGQIYGNILNGVKVVEEKTLKQKVGPGAKELNDKDAAKLQSGGPSEKGGFKEAEIDTNKLSDKEQEDNAYNIKNLSYSDEDEENVEKVAQVAINKFMSKSTFDKLYENVMMGGMNSPEDAETMELDALGIENDAGGEEMGGDEDTVTITLSKDLAKQLHDVLMGVIGGEDELSGEEEVGGEEELDGEDEMGGEETPEEDEEEMGHTLVNAKKPNMGEKGSNKVNAKLKPGSKTADGKYTDEVNGDAGDLGHALVNAKKPNMGDKGNNKVAGQTKTGKVGGDFFA